MENRRVTFLVN